MEIKFCSSEEGTVKKREDQPKTGRNLCNTHLIKDLYLGYKELSKLNSKNVANSKTWAKDMKRYFTKEDGELST